MQYTSNFLYLLPHSGNVNSKLKLAGACTWIIVPPINVLNVSHFLQPDNFYVNFERGHFKAD